MKLIYTTKDGRLKAEIDGENYRELFKGLAEFQEIFEQVACGACDSDEIRYGYRSIDGNEYYEMRCLKCDSRLHFGCHKKGGGLFAKRKDGENWLKNNGWIPFVAKAKVAASSQPF